MYEPTSYEPPLSPVFEIAPGSDVSSIALLSSGLKQAAQLAIRRRESWPTQTYYPLDDGSSSQLPGHTITVSVSHHAPLPTHDQISVYTGTPACF